MKRFFMVFSLVLMALSATAQWVDNPAINNQICSLAGEQVIPKVAVCATGETYISWFSSEQGNYNVRLQLLDADGNAVWTEPLLVSSHTSMTWLTDYDMCLDRENGAVIVFQDIRNQGNNNVYAYRISSEGEFVWGNDGLELSNSTEFDAAPKVTVTNANNAVVAWHSDNAMHLQKISANGELLWGDSGIAITSNDVSYTWPQLMPVDDDAVLLKYYEDTPPAWAPTRHVFVQKHNGDGETAWTSPCTISDAGGISAWTQILSTDSDGENGMVICWHDDRNNENLSHTYVQHVLADGSVQLADNGMRVNSSTTTHQFYPQVCYQESNDQIYCFWSEQSSSQNQRGISAQLIDSLGTRLWGNNGETLIDLGTINPLPMALRAIENEAVLFYSTNPYGGETPDILMAMRVDATGDMVWENFVTVSSRSSDKLHEDVSQLSSNRWIVVWEDDDDEVDIYAQNMNSNGSLGGLVPAVSSLPTPLWGKSLSNYPNPFNPETSIQFNLPQSGQVELNIYNIKGQKVKTLTNEVLEAGQHSIIWNGMNENGEDVASGVYFYRLTTTDQQMTKKMMLMK